MNVLDKLRILEIENNNKLNNEYFNSIIQALFIVFSSAITSDKNLDKINKFKKLLEDEISVLKDSIQNINYAELDIDCYLNPKCIQGYRYAFGKIHSLVFVDSYEFPFQMIKDELEKIG